MCMTACLCERIGLMLNRAHWWTAIAMSGQTLPVKYVSIPIAPQYPQLYFCGTPSKSLFNKGLPTGVKFLLVFPFLSPRNLVICLIKKGWVSSKEDSSSCLISSPRYLSIGPLSCSTKFSSPLWSDWINALIQSCVSPMIMQLSTEGRIMHFCPKKMQGSILPLHKPRSWTLLLSFTNQLYPACFKP